MQCQKPAYCRRCGAETVGKFCLIHAGMPGEKSRLVEKNRYSCSSSMARKLPRSGWVTCWAGRVVADDRRSWAVWRRLCSQTQGLRIEEPAFGNSGTFCRDGRGCRFVYVGSWNVPNGEAPRWTDDPPNGPLAYTGQEAAALLFGGSAGDYAISTAGSDVALIDNQAWYDVIGVGGPREGARVFPQISRPLLWPDQWP